MGSITARYVALIRGVNNICASRRVAMADLRVLFEGLGFRDVRTLLNSGNVKWLLVGVSVVAIGFVLYYLSRTAATNRLLIWSLALLAAGISGNLVDRIRLGKVIDFILIYYQDYKWPVFNIADTAITIGAALMAIELFVGSRAEGEQAVAAAAAASTPSETPIKEASTDEA